jgi:hypothetical protein
MPYIVKELRYFILETWRRQRRRDADLSLHFPHNSRNGCMLKKLCPCSRSRCSTVRFIGDSLVVMVRAGNSGTT